MRQLLNRMRSDGGLQRMATSRRRDPSVRRPLRSRRRREHARREIEATPGVGVAKTLPQVPERVKAWRMVAKKATTRKTKMEGRQARAATTPLLQAMEQARRELREAKLCVAVHGSALLKRHSQSADPEEERRWWPPIYRHDVGPRNARSLVGQSAFFFADELRGKNGCAPRCQLCIMLSDFVATVVRSDYQRATVTA